ncbi:MAG: His/Gly/Thr/Pro-type tRNA ligase C-terminal domain-containing protein [Cellulosilyticaceae bacterium]
MIIIGEDELEKGELVIKKMQTGEQMRVKRTEWL